MNNIPIYYIKKTIVRLNMILIIFIIIAFTKFHLNLSEDVNPIVFYNRNATALAVLCLYMTTLSLYDNSKNSYIFYLYILFFMLFFIFLQSRAGLVCFLVFNVISLFKFNIRSTISILLVITILLSILLLTDLGSLIDERFKIAMHTVKALLGQASPPAAAEHDYRRFILIFAGIDILKNNFLIGTGLGVENYIRFFDIMKYPTYPGLAHNFYLVYPAQMGCVGFLLFLALLKYFVFPQKLNKKNLSYIFTIAIYIINNEYVLLPEVWIFMAYFQCINRNS
ncbi:O-antigen ligase family protein [Photorhabdus tasmaniensis]|uniref:O-antigen ligase family protein n=1 Tax=Photorhabdus tasmaniensis TaxID=1004159 RepID=UPI00140C6345|nr:O-antigen ligase family protein [Photorhabdus tasmaniensis]